MGAGSSSLVRSQPSGGQSSKGGGQSSKGGGQNPYAGRTQVSQLNYMLNQPMQSPYRAPQTSYAYQPPTPQPPMAYIQPVPSPYGYQPPQRPQQGMGGKGGFQRTPQPQQPGTMSIDEFARSPLMGPTTMEMRNPVEFEGGMYDPALVRQYEQYRSGERLAGQEYAAGFPGVTTEQALEARRPQPLRQIGDMSFAQPAVMPPSETFGQSAQRPQAMTIDEFARSPLMGPTTQEARNPVEYQGSMRDPELVRRYEQYTSGQIQQPVRQESPQDFMARMNQVRQARLQFGPTPGQPQNPYASMSEQMQQMNEQMRMQQMNQQNAMRSSKGGSRPQAPQSAMRSSKGGGMDPRMAGGLAAMLTGRRMF